MAFLDDLKAMGFDTDDALARFMGNEDLYKRMLKKLPAAIKDINIPVDFDDDNYDDITKGAHTIKGVTGNLSVTPLYKAYTEIVNELRAGNPTRAREILKDILPEQEKIIAYIEENL